ncbi:MAG: hypothetical protein WDA75_04985 [Candidatus Latescibacterota bacterium]|jgi:hypothetical protein
MTTFALIVQLALALACGCCIGRVLIEEIRQLRLEGRQTGIRS